MEPSHPETTLKYKPLVSEIGIRLVVIHPGSGNELIKCQLIHTEFSRIEEKIVYEGLAYEALSYEWKEASDDDPTITVNDESITIRQNLCYALKQIRLPDIERYVWIDALCINQSDVPEQNAQIKIMGSIYSAASRVIVWLGKAENNSDMAMQLLKEISTQVILRKTYIISDEEYNNQISQLSNDYDHDQWKALVALCQRPYWSRIWVLQEVYLAKKYELRCGDKSIDGMDFEDAIALFTSGIIQTDKSADYGLLISESAMAVQRFAKQIGPTFNTLRRWIIATASGGFLSSNPRDMVYALLGVSSDWLVGNVVLIPDYDKPFPELFFEVVRIVQTKSLSEIVVKALRVLAECFKCTEDASVKEFFSELEAGGPWKRHRFINGEGVIRTRFSKRSK